MALSAAEVAGDAGVGGIAVVLTNGTVADALAELGQQVAGGPGAGGAVGGRVAAGEALGQVAGLAEGCYVVHELAVHAGTAFLSSWYGTCDQSVP